MKQTNIIGPPALILPQIPKRVKQRAYTALAFDFAYGPLSTWTVDGFSGASLFSVVGLALRMIPYFSYHKLY